MPIRSSLRIDKRTHNPYMIKPHINKPKGRQLQVPRVQAREPKIDSTVHTNITGTLGIHLKMHNYTNPAFDLNHQSVFRRQFKRAGV
jgi:hypothetical protein